MQTSEVVHDKFPRRISTFNLNYELNIFIDMFVLPLLLRLGSSHNKVGPDQRRQDSRIQFVSIDHRPIKPFTKKDFAVSQVPMD